MADRVVVVGGSSGIGLATAKLAHGHGFDVMICGRSRERLHVAVRQIGERCQGRVLDAADEPSVEAFFESLSPFAHLVVTAGEARQGPFGRMTTSSARATFEGRFWGPYVCARAAARKVRESIVLFSGIASHKPFAGMHAVAAANAAIEALARHMAVELAPVRVNVVAPGVVDTPAYDTLPAEQRAALFEGVARRIPARRVGRPEDVASSVLHLMTSPFCTGVVLDVDGGHHLVG